MKRIFLAILLGLSCVARGQDVIIDTTTNRIDIRSQYNDDFRRKLTAYLNALNERINQGRAGSSVSGLSQSTADNRYRRLTVPIDYSSTDVINKPVIPTVPTLIGAFTNDIGYQTADQVAEALTNRVLSTDSRLSDSRTPAGPAGGFLSGSYPNPGVNATVLRSMFGAGTNLAYDPATGIFSYAGPLPSSSTTFSGSAQIVFDGNSVVYGVGSTHTASNADDFTGNNFPAVARRALVSAFPGVVFTTKNFGVDGQTTPQMASDAATQIDAIFDGSYDRNILVVREISNDISLNNVTAATAYQTFVDFCQARRAKGWRLLFLTLTPRTVAPSTMTLTEYNNRKDVVNGLLRKNWPLFSDGIIDVATLSGLTFPDGVHTNDAGYAQFGALTAAKVGTIVQNGFNPTSIPPATVASASSTTTTVTSSTLVVLNGTGTNGSTVIQDASPYNRSVTNNGVTISTAQAKFGGSSLFFNGSADLDLGTSADWNLGTGDFTMETWFYATSWSNPGTNPFFARSDGTQVQWTFNVRANGASTALNVRTADNTGYLSPGPSNSTAAPALNSWHHYAVVSTGGARKLYIDGVLSATSTSFPSMETNPNSVPLKIGTLTSSDRLNGYGHFRLTKTALYTANFTPPTSF